MVFLKIETEIITSITENPITPALILLMIYVETLKTDIGVFATDIMYLTSH